MCATLLDAGRSVHLRDYVSLNEPKNGPETISEVALATLATSTFFEPAIVGGKKYGSGTLKSINPVADVWAEAQAIWAKDGNLDPLLKCFVSIGSGDPGQTPIKESGKQAAAESFRTFAAEATRSEEDFAEKHRELREDKRYFRFYVQQGLQSAGWDKKHSKAEVEIVTSLYINSQGEKLGSDDVVRTLVKKQAMNTTDHLMQTRQQAWMLHHMADRDLALDLMKKALELREKMSGLESPETFAAMENVGEMLKIQGKFKDAAETQRRLMEAQERAYGPDNLQTIAAMNNLAGLYMEIGNYDEAEKFSLETLSRKRRLLGPDHPDTLGSMGNYAALLLSQHNNHEAEIQLRQAIEIMERTIGANNKLTLQTIYNLSLALQRQDKLEEAEAAILRSLVGRQSELGPDHPDILAHKSVLASIKQAQGNGIEALQIWRETAEKSAKALGQEHPRAMMYATNVAGELTNQKRYKEATEVNDRLLEIQERTLGPDDQGTLTSVFIKAGLLKAEKKYDEAEVAYKRVLEGRKKFGVNDERYANVEKDYKEMLEEKNGA